MTNANNDKWLIPSLFMVQSFEEEKTFWDEAYVDNDPQEIFTLTIDPEFCKKLILAKSESRCCDIPNSSNIKVLIPGCGFEVYLQKTLLEFCPNIGQVYCTDYSITAIEQAKQKWQELDGDVRLNNQQLIFEQVDSSRLTEQKPEWQEKFDYVLVVSSVISGEDEINRQMLKEFYKVLKPGGKLYGSFPSIFFDLEVAHLSESHAHWLTTGRINLPASAAYYAEDNQREIYYTPLRLNYIFKEAGFKRLSFELFFAESDVFINSAKKVFEFDISDIYYWEFLVRLEKEKAEGV